MKKSVNGKLIHVIIMVVVLSVAFSCSFQYVDATAVQQLSPQSSAENSIPSSEESRESTMQPVKQRDIEGTPRVWMNVYCPADLVDTGKWEYVSANVDTVSLFIDYLNQTDSDTIREFASMLNRTGIKLGVECAGICDWYADKYVAGTDSLGRLSAQLEIDRLRRLKRAGKNVDYIIFDHPLTRAIYPNEDYSLPARMTCA
ncbi:MAG TPA: hypothetical protein GX721_10115 [Firmicutes bacterium]|jgi:hypothetical protein|nr:hypothetical protein [Bacillota bacterium]